VISSKPDPHQDLEEEEMKADAGIDHQVEVDKRKAALVEIVGHEVRVEVDKRKAALAEIVEHEVRVEVDKRKAALVEIVGHGVRVVVGQETCGSRLVRLEICHGAAVGQEVAVDPEKR